MGAELVAEDVGCSRGGVVILEGFSLRVGPGEMVALVGPSGSGKSTALAILAGLERPERGHVSLSGQPVSTGDDVGLVLQSYGLVGLLTAEENVEIVLQARRMTAREVHARSARALTDLGLGAHADHLVDELSGGQQQRVAIARALVTEPRVVLADEPTAELDATNRAFVMGALDDARRRGAIVVLATHDPDVAGRCTRIEHVGRDARAQRSR
jgi:putative ABC transport system ATP-binding protein